MNKKSEEWKQVGEPRSKKARKSRSKIKIMLIAFSFIFQEWSIMNLFQDQTANAAFDAEVLKRLC